jgi:hypothetical protein
MIELHVLVLFGKPMNNIIKTFQYKSVEGFDHGDFMSLHKWLNDARSCATIEDIDGTRVALKCENFITTNLDDKDMREFLNNEHNAVLLSSVAMNAADACRTSLERFQQHCAMTVSVRRRSLIFSLRSLILHRCVQSIDDVLRMPPKAEIAAFLDIGYEAKIDSILEDYEKYYNFIVRQTNNCVSKYLDNNKLPRKQIYECIPEARYFWHPDGHGGITFPNLAIIARRFLCAPMGSDEIEGNFSEKVSAFPSNRLLIGNKHARAELVIALNKGVSFDLSLPAIERNRLFF